MNLNCDRSASEPQPLLRVAHLTQEFAVRGQGGMKAGRVQAVSDVSFEIRRGETLGIVGETGCGKSSVARAVLQAPRPMGGSVVFRGQDLTKLKGRQLRLARQQIQVVFQDPYSSLDPKWRVGALVEEPLVIHRRGTASERARRVRELLELVGLDPERHGRQRPRQLSGGQCQRVAIARALALSPELVICDEAVSSLDVSIQAQILNLIQSLKGQLELSYLFIAHDLSVVKHVSDRVAVMYLGKLCEVGTAEQIYRRPLHPYTNALLAAIPPHPTKPTVQDPQAQLRGELPSPMDPPSGCRFRTRCPMAEAQCAAEEPPLRPAPKGHLVACHFPLGNGA